MLWREKVRRGLTLADGSVPIGEAGLADWTVATVAAEPAAELEPQVSAEERQGQRQAEADEALRQ